MYECKAASLARGAEVTVGVTCAKLKRLVGKPHERFIVGPGHGGALMAARTAEILGRRVLQVVPAPTSHRLETTSSLVSRVEGEGSRVDAGINNIPRQATRPKAHLSQANAVLEKTSGI